MNNERRLLLTATKGRRVVSVVEVDVKQADCLLRLVEQSREARVDAYKKLHTLMKELPKLELRGEKTSGVIFSYVTPAGIHEQLPFTLPLRVARYFMICGFIELTTDCEAGIMNLRSDLRSFISGLSDKTVAHPFLITEGIKPKNG